MTPTAVVWIVVGLGTSLILAVVVVALVRQAVLLARTAMRFGREAGGIGRGIGSVGRVHDPRR